MKTPIGEMLDGRSSPAFKPKRKRGILHTLDYLTRRASVRLRGQGFIENVLVPKSIPVGTEEKPKIWRGNTVIVEKSANGRWFVVQYLPRNDCAYPPATTDPEEEDYTVPEMDSFTASEFPDLVTPDLTFEPPTFKFGGFSLEGLGPPTALYKVPFDRGTPIHGKMLTYNQPGGKIIWQYPLCDLPWCEECAPDGYQDGMVPVIDATDPENPCVKWGFRLGVGEFWLSYGAGDEIYRASITSSTPRTLALGTSCISPSLANNAAVLFQGDLVWSGNGVEMEILHTGDGGATWDSVHDTESVSSPLLYNFKLKFDRTEREKGYLAAGGVLAEADIEAMLDAFSVPSGDYTAEDWGAVIRVNYDSSPLFAVISNDGGATWTQYVLDYLGDVYRNTYSGYGTNAGAPCETGDGIYPYEVGDIKYRVCGTVTRANVAEPTLFSVNAPFAVTQTVAPLEDGSGAYFIFGIESVGPDYNAFNVDLTKTNRIYLVQPDGTQSGVIEVDESLYNDPFESGYDFIWTAECDPTDTDKIYAITHESHSLLQISFGGSTTVLTAPYDMVNDRVRDLLLTPAGTLLIPVMTAADELHVYRSVDDGGSFSTIDLSAHLGANPENTQPVIGLSGERVFLATDAGKIVYSDDDGVTWNATGVILPTESGLTDLDG